MYTVIFVPGLGDYHNNITYMARLWEKEGITVHLHTAPWQEKKEQFPTKLTGLIKILIL